MNVLFICTGNLCRSPVAEAVVNSWAGAFGLDVSARSGGTMDMKRRPCPAPIQRMARRLGTDVSGHRTHKVTLDDLRWADQILVMDPTHLTWLMDNLPDHDTPIDVLATYGGNLGIPDPYKKGMFAHWLTRRRLVAALKGWAQQRLRVTIP